MFKKEALLHSKEWFSKNIDSGTYETPFTERYCYELGFEEGATFGFNEAEKSMNWILGWLENEKENRKEFEDEMKRGYLVYIYQSCATKSLYYEWKCVDPKYYTESEIEDFKKKYSVTGKLYVDFYELYYDLIKLNIKGKDNG